MQQKIDIMWLALALTTMSTLMLGQAPTYPPAIIPGSQQRELYSEVVKQQYTLYVHLPMNYGQEERTYPVLYLLDAQWDFSLVTAIYGEQYYDGFLPEMIIVGITWGGQGADPNYLRARDFIPTHNPSIPQSGGAAKFLTFIEEELIPFVESEYAAGEERALMGSSFGGLFTLYAFFSKPQLFRHYVPTSPATPWDSGSLFRFAEGFKERSKGLNLRMFAAVGELEGLYGPFKDLMTFFREKNYPALTLKSHIVANSGHSGVKAEGNTRGLQFVFNRGDQKLDKAVLERLKGRYIGEKSGNSFTLAPKGGKLILNEPDGSSRILSAAGEGEFYLHGEFFKISFEEKGGEIDGLTLKQFGSRERYYKSR